jgi:hypothetical protein
LILKVIEQDQEFDIEYTFLCHEFCILKILQYYGVKQALFFINSSLAIEFYLMNNRLGFRMEVDQAYQRGILPDYNHKIKRYKLPRAMAVQAWKKNKRKVSQGIPLIICADIYYFQYSPIYQKVHTKHSILLHGYSEDGSHVNVTDAYAQFLFQEEVPLEQFLKARSSFIPFSPTFAEDNPNNLRKIGNTWYEVERDGWKADEMELLYKTVCLTADQLDGSYFRTFRYKLGKRNRRRAVISRIFKMIPIKRFKNHTFFEKYYGMAALRKLQEFIVAYREAERTLQVEFLNNLYWSFEKIKAKKELLRLYFEQASKFYPGSILQDLIEILKELVILWKIIMNLIIKNTYLQKKELYAKIIDRFNEIMVCEESFYEALIKMKDLRNMEFRYAQGGTVCKKVT